MKTDKYDREAAVKYAHRFALGRNPKFYDFSLLGGDCTNFISQCLYSGSGIMNYAYPHGWYYKNANDRAPAWTSVTALYNFLISDKSVGPHADECDISQVQQGDIVQLKFSGMPDFSHSLIIVAVQGKPSYDNVLISTHTYDCDNRSISDYDFETIRFLHIIGVNKWA